MSTLSTLWSLSLGLLVTTAAFIWSLQVNRRYAHLGFRLLSAGLGLEILASGFLLLYFALAAGGAPDSFVLWAAEVLHYGTILVPAIGWALLSSTKRPVQARTPGGEKAAPVAFSRKGLLKWSAIGLAVVSALAAGWAFVTVFAAGQKSVPHLDGGEAWTAALPALLLIPCATGLATVCIRTKSGALALTLTVVSATANLLTALVVRIAFVTQ